MIPRGVGSGPVWLVAGGALALAGVQAAPAASAPAVTSTPPRAASAPVAPATPSPAAPGRPATAATQDTALGHELYREWCVECHGEDGTGDGPAADRMLPRPRDFVEARYQIRTTASGELPTDGNLGTVIEDGLHGTAMPGWPNLNGSERSAVIAYIKSLSRFFEDADPRVMDFSSNPGGGEEAVEAGRAVYEELECYRCHGDAGRGDGSSAPTLEDWREYPIRAADLTESWQFNGGHSVEQIHRRFLTGMDGTPMPSNETALQAELVNEEDLWNLAHYVRSLAPDRVPPRVKDAVRVERLDAGLPTAPDDSMWAEIPRFYFPLAGQVIEQPRQFRPMVDGVWVQGAHDGSELVLRVSWDDPSESPDSAWAEWQAKIAETMFDDGTPIPTRPMADRLAIQFPTELPEGRERPYFLMGSSRSSVYLWRWNSTEGVSEATATGLGTSGPLGSSEVAGSAAWVEGQWRAVFRRSLEGGERRITFPTGVAVPVAFFAWDGNNGEDEPRGSVSSWYFVILEEPAGTSVYLAPLLAVLLTGGLGYWASRRVGRRST